MFWGISNRSLLHELPCKTGRTSAINAQVRATRSRRNVLRRTHPIFPIGPGTDVFGHFGPFRYCTNFGAIHAALVQLTHNFVQRSRVETFRNERTRSTLLDSNFGALVRLVHKLVR
jgi:hypothetical protein